jgi:hypothetical protein
VRARVAVTVERQVRGLQTVEDRFLLVRASSFEDAVAVGTGWREYSRPDLNRAGQIVRWLVDEIVDVYELADDRITPDGTEVYSKLSARRLRVSLRNRSRRRTTNKELKLTKLRAAPERQAEVPRVPPRARWPGAPPRS